jgi:type VI secretion system protein ImpM
VSDGTARAGLYGKLPAHGDFVRRGLPESFVAPWDAWLQQGMAAARAALGEDFSESWQAAPTWHFRLPAGACGPDAVAGVLLPSEDLVGRLFPLTLAALLDAAPDESFYAALEAAGRAAQTADTLIASLPSARPGEAPPAPGWWRMEDGTALRWDLPGLPPPAQFRVLVEGGA